MTKLRMAALTTAISACVVIATCSGSVRKSGPASPAAATFINGQEVYGVALAADSLANTQVGGTDCHCAAPGSRTSYRFRATGDSLTSVRIFVQDGPGYSGGDGGTMFVQVQTDDGTPTHAPSGFVLATAELQPGNPVNTKFPLVSFDHPASLVADTLYHVVFTNASSATDQDFVSVNALFNRVPTTPRQPKFDDDGWTQLISSGAGWRVRPEFTPIMQLNYADGTSAGNGYMEVWIQNSQTITGPQMARESFSFSHADAVPTSVCVRATAVNAAGPLEARLETSDNRLLDGSQLGAISLDAGAQWYCGSLLAHATLTQGSSYHLVFASSAGAYQMYPIRHGTSFGFSSPATFNTGFAELLADNNWAPWLSPQQSDARQGDLQFFLTFQPAAP